MATTTTRLGLRKPATTDVVNVTTDISDNMDTIDSEVGIEVVTSFPTDPYAGKLVMRNDLGNQLYVFGGLVWLRIMVEEQQTAIMAPVEDWDTTGIASFTNMAYDAYTPTVSVTFTAPPSGIVYVTTTAALEGSAGTTAYVAWEMRENNVSGSIVHAATDDVKAVAQQDLFNHQGSTRTRATGLTPGNQYYARVMKRINQGGGSWGQIFYAGLLVEPAITS